MVMEMTYSKSSKRQRERRYSKSSKREREEVLKIQQEREREDLLKIQQERERERERSVCEGVLNRRENQRDISVGGA